MFRIHSRRIGPGTLVVLAALSLGGCARKEEESKTNTAQPAQAERPVSKAANSSSSTAAPAAPPAAAIAAADGDIPGMRVEVQELKRTGGDVVTLKFAMINDSDKDFALHEDFAEASKGVDFGSVGGVNLIDAVGKKKYFVARDTEGACLCSRNVPNIRSKSRANLWAKFPAPPADVQKISVVIPHFGPLDDVPISK